MSWAIIWGGILSFIIIMYVVLDGFDLGVGILFSMIKNPHERNIMINTIAPVWDGNETWLVFGAAVLYAAFPTAYSILLPTLYMPLMIMLAALIFRGVIFEFRFKMMSHQKYWDKLFTASSIIVSFMQGMILGTFVKGYGNTLPINYSAFHWLTFFSVMTGIAVVAGYALLGATWLIWRTTEDLQQKMYRLAKKLLWIMASFLAFASIWTPLISVEIRQRWFSLPEFFYLLPLPLLTGVGILLHYYTLNKRYEFLPFCLTIVLFIFAYIGFIISDWPYIIPHAVTFVQALSPVSTLKFMLVGVIVLLPLLIIYTIYAYSVFHGKVTEAEHY